MITDQARKKISDLFKSTDRALNRLGQKLCHAYRIPYYVISFRTHGWVVWFDLDDPYVTHRSGDGPSVKVTYENQRDYAELGIKIYKIELNGKTAEVK